MPAAIAQLERDSKSSFHGICTDCLKRGRRGGHVVIKASNSDDRYNWFKRHKKH